MKASNLLLAAYSAVIASAVALPKESANQAIEDEKSRPVPGTGHPNWPTCSRDEIIDCSPKDRRAIVSKGPLGPCLRYYCINSNPTTAPLSDSVNELHARGDGENDYLFPEPEEPDDGW
ncbi:protein of unknown function [Taphrina deformans PYCC 5710]|uniref:Uncharacterized protein n=1 Tax=Taphrina deformans (strain PYCC 5710 / ATCC 11124 / CBS 356.35 / IMI 108563 / JCM 9778 / NBRC 8474) TaxID=1097556 RepID=R4XDV9_TAPDE|nr:protein of unknown function [Taphrina deformans PYCC 5710]|eukprot:CCG83827.1 protein of unknown function [Taphrina deformans PYCC 5710]